MPSVIDKDQLIKDAVHKAASLIQEAAQMVDHPGFSHMTALRLGNLAIQKAMVMEWFREHPGRKPTQEEWPFLL